MEKSKILRGTELVIIVIVLVIVFINTIVLITNSVPRKIFDFSMDFYYGQAQSMMVDQAQGLEDKMAVMQNHIEDLLDRNAKAHKDFDELSQTLKNRDQELANCKQAQTETEQRATMLARQLQRRDAENQQLLEEQNNLRQRLCEAVSARLTATVQLDDLASREEAFSQKQKFASQEIEVLRGQKKNLEEQLSKFESELTAALAGSKELELQEQIQQLSRQLCESKEEAVSLHKVVAQEQAVSQGLRQQLATLQTMEVAHQQEMQAQVKTALLYQDESRESRAMVDQHAAAISQLQAALRDATNKLDEMQANAEKQSADLVVQLAEKDKMILALQEEIKDTNTLLEQTKEDTVESFVAKLFPTAASVSQHLQADLTLSKIYTRYAASVTELEGVRGERDHLAQRVTFLTSELQECQAEIASVKQALNQSEQDVHTLQADKGRLEAQSAEATETCIEAKRSAHQHAKDKARLLTQVNYLSTQVVHMLKEKDDGKVAESREASAPVSARMLVFSDVAELQHRNVELLTLVRELQERAEQAERALASAEDVAAVSTRLDEARAQVQRMQTTSDNQEKMVQILIRERDHYKSFALRPTTKDVALSPIKLAEVPTPRTPAPQSPTVFGSTPRHAGPPGYRPNVPYQNQRPRFPHGGAPQRPWTPGPPELQAKLRKTEEDLATVSKDFEIYKKDARTHLEMVTNQLEEMRLQLSDSKMEQASLRATNESDKDRLATARSTVDALNQQVDGLQKMRSAQDETIAQQEKALLDVHKEMVNTFAKLSQTELTLGKAQAEIRRLRVSEGALRHECVALKKSSSTQQLVLQSAQELRACRLTAEAEQRLHLAQRLDVVLQENQQLKKKHEEESARLGEELAQLQSSLSAERTALEQSRAETARAEAEVARAADRLAQAERDVLALRAHRNPVTEAEAQTDLLGRDEQEAAEKLVLLQGQLEQVSEQLKSSQAQVKKEVERATSLETKLAEIQQASEKKLLEAQQSLRSSGNTSNELRSRVTTLEAELSVTRHKLQQCEQQLASARTELQAQQRTSDAGSTSCNSAEVRALRSALAAAKEQAQKATEHVAQSTEQHRLDLQALATFRKQAVTAENLATQLKMQVEDATRVLAAAESSKSNMEMTLKNQEEELTNVKLQKEALLDQVQQMGTELCALRSQASLHDASVSSNTPLNTSLNLSSSSLHEDDCRSQEQLLSVLRHVRREKEIASTKAESLQAKLAALSVQLETCTRQLRDHEESSARQHSKRVDKDSKEMPQSQYKEIMHKLEALNALTDSNIAQREKCANLELQISRLEEQIKSLNQAALTSKDEANKAQERLNVELAAVRGEAARWRTRSNQLTERANRANPDELKRLQQERENLQKQAATEHEEVERLKREQDNLLKHQAVERENLHKQLIAEREDMRKMKITVSEKDAELNRLRAEGTRFQGVLVQAQSQVTVAQEEAKVAKENLAKTKQMHNELVNKELQVRRIAKKYKTLYEELTKDNPDQAQPGTSTASDAAESHWQARQQLEARLAEAETRAEAAETRAQAAEARGAQTPQAQSSNPDPQAQWQDRSERMRQILTNARKKISECNATINQQKQQIGQLTSQVDAQKQTLEEQEAQTAALTSQHESRVARLEQDVARLERENVELRSALADTERRLGQASPQQQIAPQLQPQQRPPMRKQQQGVKASTSGADKSSVEPPTANIRPMAGPSQAKPQQAQQSATVTPTSRLAPMARLRPMSMGTPRTVAILAPSQQQQQQQASSSVAVTAAVVPVQPEPSTSSSPAGASEAAVLATVVLVRPQEVQPAVSSSQSLQGTSAPAPTTSQPSAPTLKRVREPTGAVTAPGEPRLKLVRGEVTSASADLAAEQAGPSHEVTQQSSVPASTDASMEVAGSPEEQPSSSLHGAPMEVIIVDSDDEGTEGNIAASRSTQQDAMMAGEETVESVPPSRQVGNEAGQSVAESAEASSSSGTSRGVQVQLVRAVEALMDTPAMQPEPSSSSGSRPSALRPPQSHLMLPQQHGYEDVGDDGIVPSTPTLFVPRRREGFGEGVSSPQVPQAQGRAFTFVPESTHTSTSAAQGAGSESLEEARLEAVDDNGTGRSVPSTPLLISPQDVIADGSPSVEVSATEVDDESVMEESVADDVASSSVPSILVTPASERQQAATPPVQEAIIAEQAQQPGTGESSEHADSGAEASSEVVQSHTPSVIPMRGENLTRRGIGRNSPTLNRNNQPRSPIVWDAGQQQQQGMSRGMRRAMRSSLGRGIPVRGSPNMQQAVDMMQARGGPAQMRGPGGRGIMQTRGVPGRGQRRMNGRPMARRPF